jgi:hypothetical protein
MLRGLPDRDRRGSPAAKALIIGRDTVLGAPTGFVISVDRVGDDHRFRATGSQSGFAGSVLRVTTPPVVPPRLGVQSASQAALRHTAFGASRRAAPIAVALSSPQCSARWCPHIFIGPSTQTCSGPPRAVVASPPSFAYGPSGRCVREAIGLPSSGPAPRGSCRD